MFSIWLSAQAFWHCHLFSSREAGCVMVLSLCLALCIPLSVSSVAVYTQLVHVCAILNFEMQCEHLFLCKVRIKVSTCCYILCKVSLKAIPIRQPCGEGLQHTLQRGCWVQNCCKIHSRCHFVTVVKPAAIGGGVLVSSTSDPKHGAFNYYLASRVKLSTGHPLRSRRQPLTRMKRYLVIPSVLLLVSEHLQVQLQICFNPSQIHIQLLFDSCTDFSPRIIRLVELWSS